MDKSTLAIGIAAVAVFALAFFLVSTAREDTSCYNANSTFNAFVELSRSCKQDADCETVDYGCMPDAVSASKLDEFYLQRKKFDLCYPRECNSDVFSYEAYCDSGSCKTRQSGFTDRLYEALLSNATECSEPKVSGYKDFDQCFLALRLKSRYKPVAVRELICRQISDMRIRQDCLGIDDS